MSELNETEVPETPKRKRGRPAGSLNYRSRVCRDLMEKLKCDPLEALLRIIKNRRLPIELRLDAMKSAVPYAYPRLTTMHVQGFIQQDVEINQRIQAIAKADPALAKAMETLALKLIPPQSPVIDVPAQMLSLPLPADTGDEQETGS